MVMSIWATRSIGDTGIPLSHGTMALSAWSGRFADCKIAYEAATNARTVAIVNFMVSLLLVVE